MRGLLATLFFLVSGATGLLYEVVWARRLELTLGGTTWTLGVVLGAFMAGLGLGAWWWGRRADRPGHPARRYAGLEAGIGVWGLLAPWILLGIDSLYAAIGGAGGLFTRALFSFLALLPPTFLMGGTLPILARGFFGDDASTRRTVGWLYGVNTLGAVVGVLLADLWLVDHLGLTATSRLVGVVNLALAGLAWMLGDRLAPRIDRSTSPAVAPPRWLTSPNLVAFAVGLVGLALEVGFTRALGMALGSTRHAFAIVLAATLTGIGLGSLAVARSGSRDGARHGAGWSVLLLGFAAGGFLWCVEPLMAGLFHLIQPRMLGYDQLVGVEFVLLAAILLPATLALGATFPLVARWATTSSEHAGADLGRTYLSNTVGGIVGSVGAAFVLVPTLGTFRLIQVMAMLALGVSVAIVGRRRIPLVALALLGLGLLGLRDPWRPERLDLDPSRIRPTMPGRQHGNYQDVYVNGGLALVYAREGVNAQVAVRESGSLRQLKIGGKTDASSPNDMPTQLLIGAVPFLARPDAASVLVVGAGSGVTARVAADFPATTSVDVVEIEQRVLEAARLHFLDVNHAVLDRPEVRVIVDDARNVLRTTDRRYDVIISEPSNPHIAGIANLFTLDHYRHASQALQPRGVYMQWIQFYDTDPWVLTSMLRTFLEAFPYADAWWVDSSDLLLLGSPDPLRYDPEAIDLAFAGNEPFTEDLRLRLHATNGSDLLGRFLADQNFLQTLTEGGEILRDDLPRLASRGAHERPGGERPSALVLRLLFSGVQRIGSGNVAHLTNLDGARRQRLRLSAAQMAVDTYPELVPLLLEDAVGPDESALLARVASAGSRGRILADALRTWPEHPALRLELAAWHLDAGDRSGAGPLLDGLIREASVHTARYFLMRCRVLDPAADIEEIRSLVGAGLRALQPRESEMEVRRDLLQIAASIAAVDLLERLVATSPTDEVAALALAQAQLERRDPAACLRVLNEIVPRNFLDYKVEVRLLRIRALLLQNSAELRPELRRLLDDFPNQARNPELLPLIPRILDAPAARE